MFEHKIAVSLVVFVHLRHLDFDFDSFCLVFVPDFLILFFFV